MLTTPTPRTGFICKKCSSPSPIGIGYIDWDSDISDKIEDIDSCDCGYSRKSS